MEMAKTPQLTPLGLEKQWLYFELTSKLFAPSMRLQGKLICIHNLILSVINFFKVQTNNMKKTAQQIPHMSKL